MTREYGENGPEAIIPIPVLGRRKIGPLIVLPPPAEVQGNEQLVTVRTPDEPQKVDVR